MLMLHQLKAEIRCMSDWLLVWISRILYQEVLDLCYREVST